MRCTGKQYWLACFTALAALLLISTYAKAAVVHWIPNPNPTSTIAWDAASNWLGGQVPGPLDTAVLTNSYVEVLSPASVGTLQFNSGIIGAFAGLTVQDLDWAGGYFMAQLGQVGYVNVTGHANFFGFDKRLSLHQLTISNTATLSTGLLVSGGSTLNVAAGATLVSSGAGTVIFGDTFTRDGVTYVALVNNAGRWVHDTPGGATSIYTDFNHSGSIEVKAGRLMIAGYGSSTSTGTYEVARDAVLQLGGNLTQGSIANEGTLLIGSTVLKLGASVAYAGAGSIIIDSGHLLYEGDRTLPAITFAGVIRGGGTLNLAGLTWGYPYFSYSGLMDGGGVTNVNGPAKIGYSTAALGSFTDGGRTLNLNGSTLFDGEELILGFGSAVNVLAGTTFESKGLVIPAGRFSNAIRSSGGGENVFTNRGTFIQDSAPFATVISARFDNFGSVVVQSGVLDLQGGGRSTGAIETRADATFKVSLGEYSIAGEALVNSGSFSVLSSTVDVHSVFLNNGTTSVYGGQLRLRNLSNYNSATRTISGGALQIVDSKLAIDMGGSAASPNGIVTNRSAIRLDGASAGIVNSTHGNDALASLRTNANGASLDLSSGAAIVLDGPLENAGVVTIGSGSQLTAGPEFDYIQIGGSTDLDGVLAARSVLLNGGRLMGHGKIDGALRIGAGTLAPGSSTNQFLVSGDLLLTPDATLEMESEGAWRAQVVEIEGEGIIEWELLTKHDLLKVTGTAFIDGTLRLFSRYSTLFPLPSENRYLIIEAGNLQGHFDEVVVTGLPESYAFEVLYDSTSVRLAIVPVPEPSQWIMMLAGGLAVGIGVARRRRISAD